MSIQRISSALNISVADATIERISFDGVIDVDRTVMFYMGEHKIAKKALLLGVIMVICHILDGILTFFGMEIFGIAAEGNGLLRYFMEHYGHGTTLFLGKTAAVIVTIALMCISHRRKWVRNLLAGVIAIYLVLAIFPWFYILSSYFAKG
jgi:uncharacterized membrane protein